MTVLVIGGSNGGLDALKRILSTFPRHFAAPVVAVLHTGESSPRLLASILGSHTVLPVAYGEESDTLKPGHVYIAPPGAHLIIRRTGLLGLDHGPKVRHSRPSVDRLFTSAAAVFGDRVVGVVLSGGDGDGTDGLIAIKGRGGVSVVQSPVDSPDPGMPTGAILHDSPDYVVLLDDLGNLLQSLVQARAKPRPI